MENTPCGSASAKFQFLKERIINMLNLLANTTNPHKVVDVLTEELHEVLSGSDANLNHFIRGTIVPAIMRVLDITFWYDASLVPRNADEPKPYIIYRENSDTPEIAYFHSDSQEWANQLGVINNVIRWAYIPEFANSDT